MRASTRNRLLGLVVAIVVLVSYLASRDQVDVEGDLAQEDIDEIVDGIQGWSSPMFFRKITLRPRDDGTVHAELKESGGHRTITIFTNDGAGWRKLARFLVGEDERRLAK